MSFADGSMECVVCECLLAFVFVCVCMRFFQTDLNSCTQDAEVIVTKGWIKRLHKWLLNGNQKYACFIEKKNNEYFLACTHVVNINHTTNANKVTVLWIFRGPMLMIPFMHTFFFFSFSVIRMKPVTTTDRQLINTIVNRFQPFK